MTKYLVLLALVAALSKTTWAACECESKTQTRVVGGLRDMQQELIVCGVTIISEQTVLTAAHCVDTYSADMLGIVVGTNDAITGTDTNTMSLYLVSNVHVHPSYNSETQANDIAVITVEDPIVFTTEVGPACLPFQHTSDTFAGTQVTALGWGLSELAGPTPPTLQKLQVTVLPFTECQRDQPAATTTSQFCTYTSAKAACQLDNGGPVLWQDSVTNNIVLIGVISYGNVCTGTMPGINTRVGAYVDWISSVTPGVDYCRAE